MTPELYSETELQFYNFHHAAGYLTEKLSDARSVNPYDKEYVYAQIRAGKLACGFKCRNVGQIVGPKIPEFMFLSGSDVQKIHDGRKVSTLLGYETAEDVMQENDTQLWGRGWEYIPYDRLEIPLEELERFVSKVLKKRNPPYDLEPLEKMDESNRQWWMSLDAWDFVEALFIMNNYKPDTLEETDIMVHCSKMYDAMVRACLIGVIGGEKTKLENVYQVKEKPRNWLIWANSKGLIKSKPILKFIPDAQPIDEQGEANSSEKKPKHLPTFDEAVFDGVRKDALNREIYNAIRELVIDGVELSLNVVKRKMDLDSDPNSVYSHYGEDQIVWETQLGKEKKLSVKGFNIRISKLIDAVGQVEPSGVR